MNRSKKKIQFNPTVEVWEKVTTKKKCYIFILYYLDKNLRKTVEVESKKPIDKKFLEKEINSWMCKELNKFHEEWNLLRKTREEDLEIQEPLCAFCAQQIAEKSFEKSFEKAIWDLF